MARDAAREEILAAAPEYVREEIDAEVHLSGGRQQSGVSPAATDMGGTKRKAKANGKPRPLSSYMHFCADRRESLTAELKKEMGAAFENKMVMVKLGAEWKTLGDAAKAKYVAMAEKQKAELAAAA